MRRTCSPVAQNLRGCHSYRGCSSSNLLVDRPISTSKCFLICFERHFHVGMRAYQNRTMRQKKLSQCLVFDYVKINACPKDCVLYYNGNKYIEISPSEKYQDRKWEKALLLQENQMMIQQKNKEIPPRFSTIFQSYQGSKDCT